jgi:glycosyltransferase involved in cell wall biosynthesis
MESGKGIRQVSKNVWVTHAEIDNIKSFVSSIYSTAFPCVDYILERKKSDNEILVYEYIDHITPKISVDIQTVNKLMKLKEFAFNNADFVIASARILEQEAIKEVGNEKVRYIPNGVDVDHYRNEKHKNIILPDILLNFRNRYKKLVGYFGAISPWLWYEMLTELIEMRDDVGFLFIGPDYQNSYFNLPKSPNLLHLDAVNYKVLPGYARIFDICFIPFAPGEIAKSTSPLKLFEYFALEKPVVVPSFMDECVVFDEVFTGGSAASISEAIDAAFAVKDDVGYKNKLAKIAERNSWLQRAKEYIKIFDSQVR